MIIVFPLFFVDFRLRRSVAVAGDNNTATENSFSLLCAVVEAIWGEGQCKSVASTYGC